MKKVDQGLLAKLKREKLVFAWRERTRTTADVWVPIQDTLEALPLVHRLHDVLIVWHKRATKRRRPAEAS